MTLAQLSYFEKLAETANMGHAAAALHISQPSLSIAISKLETELNLLLFNRVGHKLLLTSDGQQLLVHARKILREVQETQLHMQSLSAERETQIRIGCIAPVLYDYLPGIMREFMSIPKNNGLKIDFTIDNTNFLIPMLKNGYFDFLICSQSEDPDLYQTLFISEPLLLLCPPGAPVPQTWDEILVQDLIGFQQRASAHHEIHTMLIRQGIQPAYRYRAPDEEGIAALVSHGFGYGFVPNVAMLKNYDLQAVPLPEPNDTFVRNIYVTRLINRPPVGASKRFVEYLKNALSPKTNPL